MKTHSLHRRPKGFTLIESMIAMAILIVAFLAMISMQVIGTKTNRFGDRMMQASALATDLAESAKLWQYDDARLVATASVTSFTDPAITAGWDMGRSATVSNKAEFSDKASDPNANTPDALGTTYTGLSTDVDKNGVSDFTRYWNVYDVDLSSSGTPDGKLVQIIVRWPEKGLGYRQITASTFMRNPAKVF